MGTTTPLHHPDEELNLTNFSNQQNSNVYMPKQMNSIYAPAPLMMQQPQTPVQFHDNVKLEYTC
jgi:hypothetical protein